MGENFSTDQVRGKVVSGWLKCITFGVHFISIIIMSAQLALDPGVWGPLYYLILYPQWPHESRDGWGVEESSYPIYRWGNWGTKVTVQLRGWVRSPRQRAASGLGLWCPYRATPCCVVYVPSCTSPLQLLDTVPSACTEGHIINRSRISLLGFL